jgi:TolA-binding protein
MTVSALRARAVFVVSILALLAVASGCSGRRVNQEADASPAAAVAAAKPEIPLTDNQKLLARVRELEAEVNRLQGEGSPSDPTRSGVIPAQTRGTGVTPEAEAAGTDPQRGFTLDGSSRLFQRALILHRAGQYGEAIAAFNQFVEDHPDHPLAGSALYYVGSAYLQQKEYKLASDALQRGITSYDRNPRISHTLRALAEAQDALQQPEEATRTRSLLANLFPGSPANLNGNSGAADAEAPADSEGATDPKNLDAPPEAKH